MLECLLLSHSSGIFGSDNDSIDDDNYNFLSFSLHNFSYLIFRLLDLSLPVFCLLVNNLSKLLFFVTMILFVNILFYTCYSSHFSAEINPWSCMLFTFPFGTLNISVIVMVNSLPGSFNISLVFKSISEGFFLFVCLSYGYIRVLRDIEPIRCLYIKREIYFKNGLAYGD